MTDEEIQREIERAQHNTRKLRALQTDDARTTDRGEQVAAQLEAAVARAAAMNPNPVSAAPRRMRVPAIRG